jgi:WD40 repeat protein
MEDLGRRTEARRFKMGERLYSVAYRPHAQSEVAIGGTRSIQLLNLARGPGPALASPLPASNGLQRWHALSMDANGTRIAARAGGPIRLWQNTGNGLRAMSSWTLQPGQAHAFALTPDGQRLVTVDCRGRPTDWQLRAGAAPQRAGPADDGPASCENRSAGVLAFSADGQWLATSDAHILRLWTRADRDAAGWREVATRSLWRAAGGDGERPTGDAISTIAFTAKNDYLAVGSGSGQVTLWSLARLSSRQEAPAASVDIGMRVSALAFDPSGTPLLAGGDDGFVTEYNVPALTRKHVTARHERSIMGVAVAPARQGGASWVSADADGYIVEWMPRPDKPGLTQAVELKQRGSAPIEAIALSHDGNLLVTAGENLMAWNLTRDKMLDTAKLYADRRYVAEKAKP